MTHAQAERAMFAQIPVVHQGIPYERIYGLVYQIDPASGGVVARGELWSGCGHSVTIARLDRVACQNPEDEERLREVMIPQEDEPVFQEVWAKEALFSGEEILYENERWTVTALLVRNWMERPYWTCVELIRKTDRLVREVWSGSISYTQSGKLQREQ